jgi:hypothetical protein
VRGRRQRNGGAGRFLVLFIRQGRSDCLSYPVPLSPPPNLKKKWSEYVSSHVCVCEHVCVWWVVGYKVGTGN